MIPHYQAQYARQLVSLEGLDLAEMWWQVILATARGISRDSIQPFDDMQFYIAFKSRLGAYYTIDLCQSTCNCQDFLRLRFYMMRSYKRSVGEAPTLLGVCRVYQTGYE